MEGGRDQDMEGWEEVSRWEGREDQEGEGGGLEDGRL